jgi:hypothetical protein
MFCIHDARSSSLQVCHIYRYPGWVPVTAAMGVAAFTMPLPSAPPANGQQASQAGAESSGGGSVFRMQRQGASSSGAGAVQEKNHVRCPLHSTLHVN